MSKSEYKLYTLYIDWVSGAVTVTDPELFIVVCKQERRELVVIYG